LYGIAILAGIGFTMSIFISNLAFKGTQFGILSHLSILIGSSCSGIVGLIILLLANLRKK
jgi:NhaA family Na+:H+ antiporter